jgi:hypothetical protein
MLMSKTTIGMPCSAQSVTSQVHDLQLAVDHLVVGEERKRTASGGRWVPVVDLDLRTLQQRVRLISAARRAAALSVVKKGCLPPPKIRPGRPSLRRAVAREGLGQRRHPWGRAPGRWFSARR